MNWIQLGVENLKAFADLGGPVVVLLIGLAVVALTVVVIKIFDLVFSRIGRNRILDRVLLAVDRGEAPDGTLGAAKGLMPDIARHAINARNHAQAQGTPLPDARERVLIEADHKLATLDWGNRILELIAQIAPLLGLFGTVLGMIDAFRALQAAGSVVDPAVLAGGIWVALMTTAAGLAVAMPVSITLSFFEARTDAARRRAEHIIEVIFRPGLHLQDQGTRHDIAA